jgi:hypothetical protein
MSGNMSRKLLSSFAALAVVLALTTFAPAAISEIYAGFPNHTGLLPPTPILTAPTANATYLIFVSLTAANGEPVLVHLTWNDPNGGLTGASYEEGYAMIMHVAAGTAPMVSTSCGDEGTCIFPYNLFVTGFGLWPGAAQAQGGLSESIRRDEPSLTSLMSDETVLTPESTGTYLLSLDLTNVNGGAGGAILNATVSWTDQFGLHSTTVNSSDGLTAPPGDLLLVHALAGYPITVSTGLVSGTLETYDLHVRGIHFGTPSSGEGPLVDSELDLSNWSEATYPAVETVVTVPSSGEYILGATINSDTSTYCPGGSGAYALGEWALLYWNGLQRGKLAPSSPRTPTTEVLQARLEGGTGFRFVTSNPCIPASGAGPTYSIETVAIRFQ